MHIRIVLYILGLLLFFVGLSMLFPLAVSLYYRDGDTAGILLSLIITIGVGSITALICRCQEDLHIKDGFAIVTGSWTAMALFGSLPFLLTGTTASFVDAFFETMSGVTTTGATIFTDVESLPHGVLFWRCQTQWMGGMGIIVLSIAILPFLGVGGMQLFKAEVPGPTVDKLRPRIGQTAKLLWGVYVLLSVIEAILLKTGGMSWFDAWCHTFTTMATGGFSTKNASVGAYNSPFIEYVIIVFMFLAGVNFALHFRALTGDFKGYGKSWEFVIYCFIAGIASILLFHQIFGVNYQDFENAARAALFQVISIGTTTGFGTADYLEWSFAGQFILFILMFIGGCSGSTGGAMKVMRVSIIVKSGLIEIKKLLHPSAILPVRMGQQVLTLQIEHNIMGFASLYVGIFVIGALLLAFLGVDLITSFGASAACIGNIGPGLGEVGPAGNYAGIPGTGKVLLSLCMLMGRLELYTVLVIFTRGFWKV